MEPQERHLLIVTENVRTSRTSNFAKTAKRFFNVRFLPEYGRLWSLQMAVVTTFAGWRVQHTPNSLLCGLQPLLILTTTTDIAKFCCISDASLHFTVFLVAHWVSGPFLRHDLAILLAVGHSCPLCLRRRPIHNPSTRHHNKSRRCSDYRMERLG